MDPQEGWKTLPKATLDTMASHFQKLADQFRTLAEHCRRLSAAPPTKPGLSPSRQHQLALFELLPAVDDLIKKGMPPRMALDTAARAQGLNPLGLEAAWTRREKSKIHRRAMVINFLTEAGIKDDEIAAILGMHPNSVSRNRRDRQKHAKANQPDLFKAAE